MWIKNHFSEEKKRYLNICIWLSSLKWAWFFSTSSCLREVDDQFVLIMNQFLNSELFWKYFTIYRWIPWTWEIKQWTCDCDMQRRFWTSRRSSCSWMSRMRRNENWFQGSIEFCLALCDNIAERLQA